jgi:hypothetical protein
MTLAPGVTGAVFTLAGAIFLSGVVVVGSVLRTGRRETDDAAPTAQPTPSEPA